MISEPTGNARKFYRFSIVGISGDFIYLCEVII